MVEHRHPKPRVNIDAISKKGPLGLTWGGKPIEHCNKYELQAMIQHQAGIIEELNYRMQSLIAPSPYQVPDGYRLRLEPTRTNWRAIAGLFGGMCVVSGVMAALVYLGAIP